MPRLRRSDCRGPGIHRRRRGRGFSYHWGDGRPVTEPDVLARIAALVIPPAWQDVWICPWANGHIQATGTDAAGRRQYRYHDRWRQARDAAKHAHVLEVARALPKVRATVAEHLRRPGLGRERVLAAAVRLLDLGFFRVGSDAYAEENGTYGLATIRKEHVRVVGPTVVFEYPAKGGKEQLRQVVDPDVREVVAALRRRRGGSPELLAWRDRQGWHDVGSDDVNAFFRDGAGFPMTAKDFRTWHATVLMAVALAVSRHTGRSASARRRAVARAFREVAGYLGNTPAVCRSSYVDPRVVDLYHDGVTVAPALERLGADVPPGTLATQGAVEAAVVELLTGTRVGSATTDSTATSAPPRTAAVKPKVDRAIRQWVTSGA